MLILGLTEYVGKIQIYRWYQSSNLTLGNKAKKNVLQNAIELFNSFECVN